MTKRLKRFPASFRFVAVTFALVATASLATTAAANPPSAQEVETAKDRVAQLAREVARAATTTRRDQPPRQPGRRGWTVSRAGWSGSPAELLRTQLSLLQARERYDAIVTLLNERARTLFMEGPGSELEFLLGASSFTDLTDRLEYVNVVATNDADLATEVQNTKNVLSAKEGNLESLQGAQQAVVGRSGRSDRRSRSSSSRRPRSSTRSPRRKWKPRSWPRSSTRSDRRRSSAVLRMRHAALAGRDAVRLAGHARGLPGRPAARVRRRVRCSPLRRRLSPPRGRRHHGAAGHADLRDVRRLRDQTQRLGGTAVNVHGRGRATLQRAPDVDSELDRAGAGGRRHRVRGEHGRSPAASTTTTSSSTRTSIPSGWPASYYGYTVIGDALNPYPLLVDACG